MRRILRVCGAEITAFFAALLCFGVVLAMPLAIAAESLTGEEERILRSAYETGEIIRLHVLADGDGEEAQRIKLEVRDALLQAFGEKLGDCSSADAAYETLHANVEEARRIALDTARLNGFQGEVLAEVGLLSLPEKRYGNVILPKGDYRALRVTIGSGKGRNWWCVLFPQLCLAASCGTADDDQAAAEWTLPRLFSLWTAWPTEPPRLKDTSF